MTTEQPLALVLADHLERFRSFPDDLAAAAELRRLHAENEALRSALIELVTVCEMHDQAIAAVIGKPPTWKDEYLNKARAALARAGEKT